MASRLPARLGDRAFLARTDEQLSKTRLRSDDLWPLLYHLADPGVRDLAPRAAAAAPRAVSVLAELLAPFAAERASTAAQQLITHFGGLGRALAASPRQLSGVLDGDEHLAASIAAARALVMAGLREQIVRSPVHAGDSRLHDYLLIQLNDAPTERLHAIFVDSVSDYIADEQIADGTITHVSASLRALLAHAFEAGAHGVILAHNHPSGSSEPSAADEAFTAKIGGLLAAVDIRLHDHLIVGGGRVVSMRARGLL